MIKNEIDNNDTNNVKAIKAGVWYTVCNFVVKGMGFITMPIFVRIMSPNDVGAFSNFSAWISILVTITTLNLFVSLSVARFDFKYELEDYISSVLILGAIVTSVFYIVALIFKRQVLDIIQMSELEFHIAFLYFLSYPAMEMYQAKMRFEYKYKSSVLVALISCIASTVLALIGVRMMDDKLLGRIIGNYVPLILINMLIYVRMLRFSLRIRISHWKYALLIAMPMIWHTLANNILSVSDRTMIVRFCGNEKAALYSVAYSCAMIVSILWMSLNSAWSPWACEMMDSGRTDVLKKASRPYIVFFGMVVFIYILIAPEVLLLMGGNDYLVAKDIMPPIMVGYVFQFVYSLYVNIETYCKKTYLIALGTSIAAIINIILNYILIRMYGYAMAAYTTLFGYIVLFLLHYLFCKKINKTNFYDTKFNFTFLIISLFVMFGCKYLYSHDYIRYTLIIIIIAVFNLGCMYFRKDIINAIRDKSLKPLMKRLNR